MSVRDDIKAGKFVPDPAKFQYSDHAAGVPTDELKKRRVLYRTEGHRLTLVFKAQALEEVGLKGHSRAEAAWSMAWDRGHATGLASVMDELEELAELLLG